MKMDKTRAKGAESGAAMLLSLVIIGAILLSGTGFLFVRLMHLRGGREITRGLLAYYCAEAGLHAGRDYFRAHVASWDTYLSSSFVLTGQAAPTGGTSSGRLPASGLSYRVAIRDNVDELPPLANNPLVDVDRMVLLESTCTDLELQTPIVLRSYLGLVDPKGVHGQLGPTVYDTTYHVSPTGPCFTGNHPVDGDGGLASMEGGSFSTAGILAIGVDLRDDEIKLQQKRSTFPFIWLANSGEGTLSKLSTESGQELGRYRTGPGDGNPSRTAVDLDGNVWVGNRANNTITKIGLLEAGNCVDRNGDGLINTSIGGQDVKTWSGTWGGGVSGALDECVLQHLSLSFPSVETPSNVRLVAIDKDNYVYAGGTVGRGVYKIRGEDGVIIAGHNGEGGHYGGLVDPSGNLWVAANCSAYVQRFAPDLSSHTRFNLPYIAYGIALDAANKLWISECWGTHFMRMELSGAGLTSFTRVSGGIGQGLAVDGSGQLWLAGTLGVALVDRYNLVGGHLATYALPAGATGLAVDHKGRIWTSNYYNHSTSRIDPQSGAVTTFPIGSLPYNYSDMTGFVVRNFTTRRGTWTVRQDCGVSCHHWKVIEWWVLSQPAGTAITVRARSAEDPLHLGGAPWKVIQNGVALPQDASGLPGRIIEVQVQLSSTVDGVTPVLDKISLTPWSE